VSGVGTVGSPEPALDAALARMREKDPAPWGWRPVLAPCLALIGLVVAGSVVSRLIRPRTFEGKLGFAIVANAAVQALLLLAIWFAGRKLAARHGGWGPTFGWRRPVPADLKYAAAGFGIALAARAVVTGLANAFTNGRAAKQAQNLHLHSTSLAVIVLLVVITVLCAPAIEELMFRGLLLRALMTRFGFWPAAIVSTGIFAAVHTYEVNTLVGALTLAGAVATIGLTNCVLVRLTNRLTPGIAVHAGLNALGAAILIIQARR
jgi:uncharacterized protein